MGFTPGPLKIISSTTSGHHTRAELLSQFLQPEDWRRDLALQGCCFFMFFGDNSLTRFPKKMSVWPPVRFKSMEFQSIFV